MGWGPKFSPGVSEGLGGAQVKRVSISYRLAQSLLDLADDSTEHAKETAELALAMKPKRSVKLSKARKETKKKAKRAETSEIRAEVMRRADCRCEYCGTPETNFNPLTLEHMFGRVRVPQRVENCWSLCLSCHRQKTDGIPSAALWFDRFAIHAQSHGYSAEVRRALNEAEWSISKKAASALSRGVSP